MIVTLALAVLIGITLGLLGGGGSILAVPVLTYAAGMPPKTAIATSLLVVGTTALFALIPHAKRGAVDFRTGAFFALAAMVGAYGGGRLAEFISGPTLILLFAGLMAVTAVAMFVGKAGLKPGAVVKRPVLKIALEGIVVGSVTGLVGAGGGFMVVPALVVLGGMTMHKAVGTSLFVIGLKSFAAYAGHAQHVQLDVRMAALVTAAAVVGSLLGSMLAERVPADRLKKGFAGFVLLMASYVVWRELGTAFGLAASVLAILLIGFFSRKPRLSTPSPTSRA